MDDTKPEDQNEPAAAEAPAPPADDTSKRHLAVIDALGTPLDEGRRTALLAAVGDDLSAEKVQATAKEWGWVTEPAKPAATPEQQAHAQQVIDGGNAAAADQAPPPPPEAPIQNVMQKAQAINNPAELQKLLPEAMAAIQQTPGLVFGPATAEGGFEPL